MSLQVSSVVPLAGERRKTCTAGDALNGTQPALGRSPWTSLVQEPFGLTATVWHSAVICPVQVVVRGQPWQLGSYRSAEVMAEYVASTAVAGMTVLFRCLERLFNKPAVWSPCSFWGYRSVGWLSGWVEVKSLLREHGSGHLRSTDLENISGKDKWVSAPRS